MGVWIIFTVGLYILGMVPTYIVFKETTSQPTFNRIWFTVLWPTVAILQLGNTIVNKTKTLIGKIKSLFKKNK